MNAFRGSKEPLNEDVEDEKTQVFINIEREHPPPPLGEINSPPPLLRGNPAQPLGILRMPSAFQLLDPL